MKKNKKYLFVSLAIVAIGILSLELIVRNHYQTKYISSNVHEEDSLVGFTFIPNGYFQNGNDIQKFNQFGYIGDNWNIQNPIDTYRIAILGACVLTGALHIEDSSICSFPEMLTQEINRRGYKVEILNFGMPGESRGYSIFKTIEYKIQQFKPDLILMEYILPFSVKDYVRDNFEGYQIEYLKNYPETKTASEEWVRKLQKREWLISIIDNIYILKLLGRNYVYKHDNNLSKFLDFADKKKVTFINQGITGAYTLEKSFSMLKDQISKLDPNTRFYLFQYSYNQSIIKSCSKYNVPLLSLGCRIQDNMFYRNDAHFNCSGQLEIKKSFMRQFQNLIPKKYLNCDNDEK